MEPIEFISEYRFYIFLIVGIIVVMFRNKIKELFQRKKKIDYSSRMDNGQSFEEQFDFNKTTVEERDKYKGKMDGIDKELKTVEAEEADLDRNYNKKKIMMVHREKQLKLQYNAYVANLKNLNEMVEDQEKMEEELGK